METTKDIFAKAEEITALVETTGTGVTTEYVEIPVEVKDEKTGEKVVKQRKLYNKLAVNALVNIDKLLFISSKSTKGLVLGMAKLTKAHAEAVGLKSVKALLHNKFGKELDVNTIEKYRRIGLLFAADRNDPNNYEWREGIDSEVSVSNLDVVMTLFNLKENKINLENCTDDEIDEMFADFYGKYIVLDRIHLLASQKSLKEEVKEILNPSIEAEAIIKDADENGADENGVDESATESALKAITTLRLLFKGNKDAEKALKKLADMIDTLS